MKDRIFPIFRSDGDYQALRAYPEPSHRGNNFAVLGKDVEVIPGSGSRVSGTSVATALAAGLAAGILDFARHTDSRKAGCDPRKLRTKAGMTAVFRMISRLDEQYQCIVPSWLLGDWNLDDEPTRARMHEVIKEATKRMR